MLLKNTETYFFQNQYAVVNDNLIDFKNKVFYKIYKINEKETKNDKFATFLEVAKGGMFILKTQNYNETIFGANYSSFIFKQFETEDFLVKTQEQLSKRSAEIYDSFKVLEVLYKEFDGELRQRTSSLSPKKTMYCLVPLKFGITEKETIDVMQKYKKLKDAYFTTYNKMIKTIDKYTFKEYLEELSFLNSQNKDAEMVLYSGVIEPSFSLVTDNNAQVVADNKKLISEIETNCPMFSLSGTSEVSGIFDSCFYDEVFLGDKYYNVLTFYNEQIAGVKSGEKYFPIIKKIVKGFDSIEIYNNRVLVSSSENNILYFIATSKNNLNRKENIFSTLDNTQDNFDMVLKIQEIDKQETVKYIDDTISSLKLKITTVINKERESSAVLETLRTQLKNQMSYYTELRNKILSVNERVYSVSGYMLKRLILKNQQSLLSEKLKLGGIDIRQLIPDQTNFKLMLDMKNDISGFFIHTKPASHFLNPFYYFKNTIIINSEDKTMLDNISKGSI